MELLYRFALIIQPKLADNLQRIGKRKKKVEKVDKCKFQFNPYQNDTRRTRRSVVSGC